jgi:hypothetical protein
MRVYIPVTSGACVCLPTAAASLSACAPRRRRGGLLAASTGSGPARKRGGANEATDTSAGQAVARRCDCDRGCFGAAEATPAK